MYSCDPLGLTMFNLTAILPAPWAAKSAGAGGEDSQCGVNDRRTSVTLTTVGSKAIPIL
jgi:hypothetical protein